MTTITLRIDRRNLARAVNDATSLTKTTRTETLVMDSGHLGLGIRIKPRLKKDGKVEIKKTWVYYHRHGGFRPRVVLAPYSENALEAMQTKATEMLASHLNGTLEAETKAIKNAQNNINQKEPLDLSISEICDLYLQSKIFMGQKPSTQVEIESKIRLHIKPGLGDKTLGNLIREDVINWRDNIKPVTKCHAQCSGHTTANRAKQYFSGIITWYIGLKDLQIRNVCRDWPKKFASRPEETRKEGLGKQILFKLGEAFRKEYVKSYSAACDCILLDLLTGGRRSEIEGAICEYVYIDDNIAMIELPKGKAKQDSARVEKRMIFLGKLGKSIIEKHILGKSPKDKIFQPMKGGKGKVATRTTWKNIRAAAGRPDLKLHGLRHIWTSAAKAIKTAEDVREFMLGHAAGKVVYGEFDTTVLASEINEIENRILAEFGLVDITSGPNISDCLSVKDFCQRANISKTTLYQRIKDRVIEPRGKGRHTFIPIDQISRLRA